MNTLIVHDKFEPYFAGRERTEDSWHARSEPNDRRAEAMKQVRAAGRKAVGGRGEATSKPRGPAPSLF